MNRRAFDAEVREDKISELIAARTKAIRTDLLLQRVSTTDAILARLPIADEDEARSVLWNAVTAGSSAVGADRMQQVDFAIFQEAEALAEADVKDMERRREQSEQDARIELRVWNHFFSRAA